MQFWKLTSSTEHFAFNWVNKEQLEKWPELPSQGEIKCCQMRILTMTQNKMRDLHFRSFQAREIVKPLSQLICRSSEKMIFDCQKCRVLYIPDLYNFQIRSWCFLHTASNITLQCWTKLIKNSQWHNLWNWFSNLVLILFKISIVSVIFSSFNSPSLPTKDSNKYEPELKFLSKLHLEPPGLRWC